MPLKCQKKKNMTDPQEAGIELRAKNRFSCYYNIGENAEFQGHSSSIVDTYCTYHLPGDRREGTDAPASKNDVMIHHNA